MAVLAVVQPQKGRRGARGRDGGGGEGVSAGWCSERSFPWARARCAGSESRLGLRSWAGESCCGKAAAWVELLEAVQAEVVSGERR